MYPLSVVAAHDRPPVLALRAGSLAVLSAELELPDGPWRGSVPLAVGAAGSHSAMLVS